MRQWQRLGMMALVLLLAGGCVSGGSPESRAAEGRGQPPEAAPARFTKAANGVITDSVTGLEWYLGPDQDNTWRQARDWAANLAVAGGGWRLPTLAELKVLYQKGASPINMDPLFQAGGAWVWSGELRNAWSAWGYAFYNGLEGWHHLDYAKGRVALAVRSRK
jgi:hypothetical protein